MQNNNAYQEIPLSSLRHKGIEYPRERPSGAAISRYVDALKAGETFAPITVYQDEDGTFPVLDGYHRWQAYQDCGLETIQAIVVSLNGDHPLLVAARLNARHGVAMGNDEKKEVARTVIIDKLNAKEDITNKELALQLGVREQTIGEWVKDLRAAQTHERDATILRLDLLGWTQDEIGSVVGLAQSKIAEKLSGNDETTFRDISQLATAGHALDTIATRTGLDELLCLALLLKDKDDRARLSYLKIGLQPYDVWNFNGCDDRFGADYPGRIPGQLVAHVLYFFTKAGDWIIDPMAGSGTTNDVCLAMGRRCYSYDLVPFEGREDIIAHDWAQGSPERLKKANLIFWDPPYFSKKDYAEDSISHLSASDYLGAIESILAQMHAQVKPKTRLAFLMSDFDDPETETGIFVWDYARLLQDVGWRLIRHIQTPLSTQLVHPDIVNRFREQRRLARLERYLLIAEA